MSEALYRRYRPQTFDDVVGQTHVERTLKNAIEADNVSHAYLFCGPRGTGKTTTARLLAKALLCEGGPTPAPDGTCEQCVAIAEGTHPDVYELDAASRTGVENVREEIIGRVQYSPTRGRFKIYIIDEVHMLSTAAFNALLKTLEEPPGHVVFIMCTTDPHKVPETIRSRCQRFDFRRLSNEEIVSRLGAVCMAEGVKFEGDALDLIAHRAQGGMRDALTSLEQLIAFGGGEVTCEVARSVLGSLDVDDMSAIVEHIAARDVAACFTWMAEYVETGADLAQFAHDLASYVRDLYVLLLTDGAVAVNAPQSSLERMAAEASEFGIDRLAHVLDVLGDLNAELRASTNPRLSFEIALMRMARPQTDLTLESLAARVEALEQGMASGAVAGAPAASAAPAAGVPGAVGARGGAAAGTVAGASGKARDSFVSSVPAAASGLRPRVTANEANAAPSATGARGVGAADACSVAGAATPAPTPAPAPAAAATPAPAPAAASARSAMPAPATSAPAVSRGSASRVSDAVREKVLNPAALQRGWQAALSNVKSQRAAYGALLLSAHVVAEPDGSGIAIAFSNDNAFSYKAAQKPDVSALLAPALSSAFGGEVPFRFTQGDVSLSGGLAAAAPTAPATPASAASAASCVAPASRPAVPTPAPEPAAPVAEPALAPAPEPVPQPVPASAAPAQPLPWEDEVVPYTDADIASYVSEDDFGFEEPSADAACAPAPAAAPAPVVLPTPAPAASAAPVPEAPAPAPAPAAPAPASIAASASSVPAASTVEGPVPVDPYPLAASIGFDSMPDVASRSRGMVEPVGWPQTLPKRAAAQASASVPIPASAPALDTSASAAPAPASPAADDAPAPAEETMAIEDIFGTFGVSMSDVSEER